MSFDATRIHDVNDAGAWPFGDTYQGGDTAAQQQQHQNQKHQVNESPLERDAMTQPKHFSASELAGVAGMPSTARGVKDRAEREAWPARKRAGRGGGSEYPISCLPAVTQAALADEVLSAASAAHLSFSSAAGASFSSDAERAERRAALFDAKPESIKAEARRRLALVREFFDLLAHGVAREAAASVVTKKNDISTDTLGRYLALVRGRHEQVWLFELSPRHAGRVAEAEMSAEAWEELKRDYLRGERPSAKACVKRLANRAEAAGWSLPSERTMERRLAALPRGIRVLKRDGLQALKDLYPPQQRDKSALSALEIVNADGYEHNVWVKDELGRVYRPKTWFWQDVYSSKILAWRIGETEHTEQIQFSFGALCRQWGIPRAATLDNTMAAANKTMSGGIAHRFRFRVREDEPDGVFKLLGVAVHWTTPRHGQAKPIERLFGIGGAGEYIDKAPELAGAWSGASVFDKPEYDGRKRAVPIALLEQVIEREVAALNAMPGRRSALHNGRSFDQVFAESYAQIQVVRASEEQERLWLLSTEPVRADSRNGSITLDAGRVKGERLANRYWDASLFDYAGRMLVAKFDPRRLHQGVHVYTPDGKWLCYAACDRAAGFNDQAAARERNRAKNTFVRAQKDMAEATVRMAAFDHRKPETLPGMGGVAAGTIPAPKVIRALFNEPLERPRAAAAARIDPAELAALEAELAGHGPAAAPNVLAMRDDERHAYWKRLDARQQAGEALAEHERAHWVNWQQQDYFRIACEADADFERGLEERKTA